MANKKINDLSLAGAVGDTMQFETDIGGATANKITTLQTKDYTNAGKSGGKTIEGGTGASENLLLDSTSNVTKGDVQVADGSNLYLGTGGLKDNDVSVAVALGDASNTSNNTTLKSIIGSANSNLTYTGSSGLLTGGTMTDAGGGNIDVALGNGFFRTTDSHVGVLVELPWSQAAGQAIPTDTARYVGVDYNAGSPVIVLKASDSWNRHTEFRLGSVVNESGTLHILNNPWMVANASGHAIERFFETSPYQRADRIGGLIIDETGTRNVTITAGELYDLTNEFSISAFDTSGSDTFDTYLGATAESAAQTQWDNLNYNNSGVLTALGVGKWATLWWYLEACGCVVMVYGTVQHNNQAQADLEGEPSATPLRTQVNGLLIGRTVFQQNAATGDFQSVFLTTFAGGGSSDHTQLSNLTVGDSGHTQFALLAGRSGGQTANGGTGASENLILSSTTHATKGEVQSADPITIPNASGGDLLTVGVGTDASNPRVTLVSSNSGYAAPSNSGGNSLGDKWVFWNLASYKGAIGFNARTMWFQSTEGTPTTNNKFQFFAGSAGSPVELLTFGDDAGWVWNETGLDLDFRCEGDTDANLFFVDASTDRVGIGIATPAVKFDVAGDTKISSGTLAVATGTTVNEFSIDGTLAGNSDDALVTEKGIKTYVDGHTANGVWERVGTTISPKNTGDDVDLEGGTFYGNNSVSGNLILDSTSDATKGDVQIANGTTLSALTANYETLVIADDDIPNKKYVDDQIGGVDEFSELTDVTGAYTTQNAIYNVNDTTDGLQETTTTLTEVAPDSFTLTRGTTQMSVITNCLINQNLSQGSDVTFESVTIDETFFESVSSIDTLEATNTILSLTMNVPIVGNAAPVTLTSNPQISAGINGQGIRLIGTSDTNTVTVVDGNGLALDNGQSFTLGLNNIIEFIFYNSLWIETSRKDN